MDRVDQNTENKYIISKKFEKNMVTEPLDTTPQALIDDLSGKFIAFGNTGLIMSNEAFDFVPEHLTEKDETQMAKHALMLSSAFYRLYGFLNNPSEMSQHKMTNLFNVDKIYANTNSVLINALEKLFNKSNVKGLVTHDEIHDNYGFVAVNLKSFKNLSKDDPLIIYLKRLSEKAKSVTVKYMKTVAV